jgi:hypothetical protein
MPSMLECSRGCVLSLLIVTSLIVTAASHPAEHGQAAALEGEVQSQDLALYEAEILIYLIPPARADRGAGRNVSWELEEGDQLDQRDFFNFWVVGPPNPNGSSTIGYFSVNKHTAEVWNKVLFRRIDDTELKGVQEILRRAHRIDTRTMEKYRDMRP